MRSPKIERREKMIILENKVKDNFSIIPNKILCAKELSFGARILLCYLLSKPNDWQVWNNDIMSKIGIKNKDTISKYFKELIENGWLERKRGMKEGKLTGGYVYKIVFQSSEKTSKLEKPVNGKNQEYNNTDLSSNTKLSTNTNIKEEIYKEEKNTNNYFFNFDEYDIDNLQEFGKVIQEWIDYKRERHNKYTDRGFSTFVKRLINLSNGEYKKAQEIVDISIANNYQGIFPLKGRM